MQYLWGMINLLQLITIMGLMSINLPGLASQVNSVLMQMAQVNLLPATDILSMLFREDLDSSDSDGMNDYFEDGGFGST